MGLEARVEVLEVKHSLLDESVHSLAKVTADIKCIALENQQKINVLAKGQAEIRKDVAALKSDVDTLKSDVNALKSDVNTLKSDVNALKSDVNTLKSDVNALKASVSALTEATYAGFKRSDEKSDQIELLIRQLLPNATN